MHNFSFEYAKRLVWLLIQAFTNANCAISYMETL